MIAKVPRNEPGLSRVNLLDLAPARVAAWQESRGRVVVERPRPASRGARGWLARLSWQLAPRRLRLDAVGSFAWKRLDGSATVCDVAEQVRKSFGEGAEPVEERLGTFVRMLRREGLVAYPGWDAIEPLDPG